VPTRFLANIAFIANRTCSVKNDRDVHGSTCVEVEQRSNRDFLWSRKDCTVYFYLTNAGGIPEAPIVVCLSKLDFDEEQSPLLHPARRPKLPILDRETDKEDNDLAPIGGRKTASSHFT
jgi:hypothetical protein